MGAVAGAGDGERKRALAVCHAEMQGGEPAHREPDDVGFLDLELIQNGEDVVAGALLRIALETFGDLGRRIAARVERYAAVAAREVTHLRLPATVVARELVDENDRESGAGLFVEKLHTVIGI